MARIRTIKPEFPQSESMGRVSRDARLCFIMLWTFADDSGRLRGNSRMLASLLFPYDEDAPRLIDWWLSELERENCLVRYSVEGHSYIEIRNWLLHQKIDKPSASKFPPFENIREDSENVREDSSLDQGPRTKDQGPRKGEEKESNGYSLSVGKAEALKNLLDGNLIPEKWLGADTIAALDQYVRWIQTRDGRAIDCIALRTRLSKIGDWSADRLRRSLDLTISLLRTDKIFDADSKAPKNGYGKPVVEQPFKPLPGLPVSK